MADSCGLHKDWYSILGACPTDDIQELKQKYQKLILMVGTQQMFPYIRGSQTGNYITLSKLTEIAESSHGSSNCTLESEQVKTVPVSNCFFTLNSNTALSLSGVYHMK